MFQLSKYTKWYYSIIQKAQQEQRLKGGDAYYESHHIIPKSLKGPNTKENLVLLTFREHFLCHRLLCKMVSSSTAKNKMQYALFCFLKGNKEKRHLTVHQYQVSLKANREASKSRMHKPMLGKKHSIETIEKIRLKNTGHRHSIETIEKIRLNNIKTNKSRGLKVSNALKGKTKSADHRKKLSEAGKKYWKEKRKMVDRENFEISSSVM